MADAVTLGDDVYFAEGEYRPGDPAGDDLLAHELAHVVQRDGVVGADGPMRLSREEEPLEQDADAHADLATRGLSAGEDATPFAEQAARSVALRATRPAKRRARSKEPSRPLGEMGIVDRLAGILLGVFWKDPEDKSGRLRAQLSRLGEKARADVLEVIDSRLADADKRRFAALVDADLQLGTEVTTPQSTEGDGNREQRNARTDEETAAKRNSDPKSDDKGADASGERKTAAAKGEEPDEDKGGAEDPAGKEGGEQDASESGDESGKSGAKKTHRKKKGKKKGKHGKEKEKKKGEKAKENAPDKPVLADGKGDAEKKGAGEAKPEGAEVESKHGGGAHERPGAGAPADASVDASPFDRLLAQKSRVGGAIARMFGRRGKGGARGAEEAAAHGGPRLNGSHLAKTPEVPCKIRCFPIRNIRQTISPWHRGHLALHPVLCHSA